MQDSDFRVLVSERDGVKDIIGNFVGSFDNDEDMADFLVEQGNRLNKWSEDIRAQGVKCG